MVYNTGSRDDWDYISRIAEDPAWAWDAMAHHRDLNQRYVAPNDGHDDVSQDHDLHFSLILIIHSRRINTSHRHTAVTGWYPSVSLGIKNLSIQKLLQPSLNQPFHPIFLSNGT